MQIGSRGEQQNIQIPKADGTGQWAGLYGNGSLGSGCAKQRLVREWDTGNTGRGRTGTGGWAHLPQGAPPRTQSPCQASAPQDLVGPGETERRFLPPLAQRGAAQRTAQPVGPGHQVSPTRGMRNCMTLMPLGCPPSAPGLSPEPGKPGPRVPVCSAPTLQLTGAPSLTARTMPAPHAALTEAPGLETDTALRVLALPAGPRGNRHQEEPRAAAGAWERRSGEAAATQVGLPEAQGCSCRCSQRSHSCTPAPQAAQLGARATVQGSLGQLLSHLGGAAFPQPGPEWPVGSELGTQLRTGPAHQHTAPPLRTVGASPAHGPAQARSSPTSCAGQLPARLQTPGSTAWRGRGQAGRLGDRSSPSASRSFQEGSRGSSGFGSH